MSRGQEVQSWEGSGKYVGPVPMRSVSVELENEGTKYIMKKETGFPWISGYNVTLIQEWGQLSVASKCNIL